MRFLCFLLCCLLLTGCAGAQASPTAPTPPSATVSTTQPAEILTVYTPNDQADALIITEVEVREITKATVVAQLKKAGVLTEKIMVNALETDTGSKRLTADFNAPFRQLLQTMGTAGEYVVMGSIVNTFLSAFDAEYITITVEGHILETGHSVYDQPLTFYPENP